VTVITHSYKPFCWTLGQCLTRKPTELAPVVELQNADAKKMARTDLVPRKTATKKMARKAGGATGQGALNAKLSLTGLFY
jgi:hypothetical protein